MGPYQPNHSVKNVCRAHGLRVADFMAKNLFLGTVGRVDLWMYVTPLVQSDTERHGVIIGDTWADLPPDHRKFFDWSHFNIDDGGNIEIHDNDVKPNLPEMIEIYSRVAEHWPTDRG